MNRGDEGDSTSSGTNLLPTVTSHTNDTHRQTSTWPYETVQALNGNYVTHLRSSLFYGGALVTFIGGVILLSQKMLLGGFLVLTLAPFLLIYPLVRFLFGGKDSAVAVVTTVIVEEVLKNQIMKAIDKSSKK